MEPISHNTNKPLKPASVSGKAYIALSPEEQGAEVLTEEQCYRQLAENSQDLIIATNLNFTPIYISPSAESILGYPADQLHRDFGLRVGKRRAAGTVALEHFLRQELIRVKRCVSREHFDPLSMREMSLTLGNGRQLCLEVNTSMLRDSSGEVVGMLCVGHDISARKENEESLALAAKVFDNSLTGIYITDANGRIVRVNQAFTRLTGFSAEDVVNHPEKMLRERSNFDQLADEIRSGIRKNDYWEGELRFKRHEGREFHAWVGTTALRDSSRRIVNIINTFTDITEKKNNEVKIQRLAYFDPLTGLPNRTLANDRLLQALNRAKRADQQVGLLFLDLDRFKSINDSLGHTIGDELLVQVGKRLRDCVRSEDTVARMGGDEFIVILAGLADKQHAITAAAHVAEKIRHTLSEPYLIQDRELFTSASTGIAFYPNDGGDAKTLLKNADTAMYHAKKAGKNNYQFYTPAMNVRALERLEIESDLHKALSRNEFELHYQPIIDPSPGGRWAVEALLRWHHPEKGLVMPGAFIDIAEESGMIKSIGAWVMRRACEQMVEWQRMGVGVSRISINVSARQFIEGCILQTLREVVAATGVDPHTVVLELTESTLMQDHQYTLEILNAFKDLGVGIAVDDFGAGYSSLNYLKKFPIDSLKVDRSFVEGLPGKEDERIVQAIVALAQSLELKVVAEGVETQHQLKMVRDLGCEEVQGYLLSRPLPVDELTASWRTWCPGGH